VIKIHDEKEGVDIIKSMYAVQDVVSGEFLDDLVENLDEVFDMEKSDFSAVMNSIQLVREWDFPEESDIIYGKDGDYIYRDGSTVPDEIMAGSKWEDGVLLNEGVFRKGDI
jgi:hypothetical protein